MQAQQDLAEVNALQEALAHIKTDFDGLKPDIALICDRLKLFGDIWQNVSTDLSLCTERLTERHWIGSK